MKVHGNKFGCLTINSATKELVVEEGTEWKTAAKDTVRFLQQNLEEPYTLVFNIPFHVRPSDNIAVLTEKYEAALALTPSNQLPPMQSSHVCGKPKSLSL